MGKHQTKSPATKNGIPHVPQAANGRRVRQVEPFRVLFDIIQQLEDAKISYTVSKYRYDAVSIFAHLPGERWEIDVMEDGDVAFERFVSNGSVDGEEEMTAEIRKWKEIEENSVQ